MQLWIDIGVLVEASNTIKENFGPGKRYPGGPTCKFPGKDVPCFVRYSPKRGITSDLLTQMLECMYAPDLFLWKPGGPIPSLLLHGHHSRFQLPFLKYINDQAHLWKVCISVPNRTAFWQVGNSPGKNGAWKISLAKAKRELVRYKRRMGFDISILCTYIILPIDGA